MSFVAALVTITLLIVVFKILAITMRENQHLVFAVIERAELLEAIKAERVRSLRAGRA